MKADIFNFEEEKIGTMELPALIFGKKWNPDLVHQAVLAFLAERRKPVAHAKDRSEVSGGGRKPWKQKGTGRARHGSNRSPIWIGGGATFGPLKEKIYFKKLNKKMKQGALASAISKRMADGEVKIVEGITPEAVKKMRRESVNKKTFASLLLIPSENGVLINQISRNASKMEAISPKSVNVYDLLRFKRVWIEKGAVAGIKSRYAAEK